MRGVLWTLHRLACKQQNDVCVGCVRDQVLNAVQATQSFTARDWCSIREYDYYLPLETIGALRGGAVSRCEPRMPLHAGTACASGLTPACRARVQNAGRFQPGGDG